DPGSSGGHVVGTNLYAVQEQSIFAPPFPTMMFDLNKGSGSTPDPTSFNDHQYNTFCDLATIHGMAISSLSVPVHQCNEFDASLDFFQGRDAER
ncbi:hypothetical protein HAX54_003926, partial [Datura stramonium]|nr:hypothetical protein [Datura stramonium]